ncbi:MAG: glycine cleavage system protein R [Puniceicoccales bacterium]
MPHAALIITLSGRDRPGLVEDVSRIVNEHGGNWTQSRMAHLGQRFVGLLEIHTDADSADALCAALRALPELDLTLHVDEGAAPAVAPSLTLEVVGSDQKGIVRRIAKILADGGFNIEELTSGVEAAPDSGALLFRAKIRLSGGSEERFEPIRAQLESLAHDLMVDLRLD